MENFFLVALPGLEDVVEAELLAWRPELQPVREYGGVAFAAPLDVGFGLNYALKTPTRILWRIAEFRCRDFPKLYNKVRALPWGDWLAPGARLSVEASTRLSRLKIKKRIEETCREGFNQTPFAGTAHDVTLFARFHSDECTLSLDTSGERLHKRGEREHVGVAPLRETLAAALIEWVAQGNAGEVELFDPMVGSGTFLLEAAQRGGLASRRDYAFGAFAHPGATPPPKRVVTWRAKTLVGWDADRKALKAARNNLARHGARLDVNDVFTAAALPPLPRWVFLNPPYGERLEVKGPLRAYYERLFEAVERVARPERACVILPAKVVKGKFRLPPRWRVVGKRAFSNGGIPVVAFHFETVTG